MKYGWFENLNNITASPDLDNLKPVDSYEKKEEITKSESTETKGSK